MQAVKLDFLWRLGVVFFRKTSVWGQRNSIELSRNCQSHYPITLADLCSVSICEAWHFGLTRSQSATETCLLELWKTNDMATSSFSLTLNWCHQIKCIVFPRVCCVFPLLDIWWIYIECYSGTISSSFSSLLSFTSSPPLSLSLVTSHGITSQRYAPANISWSGRCVFARRLLDINQLYSSTTVFLL